jgi:Anti-sigma-K factor rskA, C-terminal
MKVRLMLTTITVLTLVMGLPTLYADTGLKLNLDGLEPLGVQYVYEGWLIVDGAPVTTGTFSVSPGGVAHPRLFPVSMEDAQMATTFVITIEPAVDHDPNPSAIHVLAGDFTMDSAELTVDHPAALGDDFSMASGGYILETPSTGSNPDDYNQGIWFLDPAGGPGPSLDLPTLPEGWVYEGWVAGMDGPVTTGRFTMVSGADGDMGGMTAGIDSTPPFPGQDYINPPIILTDGYAAVISIEPDPDNSDAPFAFKPLIDMNIEDVGPGVLQSMTNMADAFPTGTALLLDIEPVSLEFENLPVLGEDYVYEGWIVGHGPVSTGIFTVDGMGHLNPAMFYVETDVVSYAAKFVLSIEPAMDAIPGPSNTKLLAGDFSGPVAMATVDDMAALGTDFAMVSGGYILETPSSSETEDYDQGIWFLDPAGGPGPSLDLPELPEGWVYEGWVAGMDGPVTTGRFTMVSGADSDMGGSAAGPNSTPPFPGQDFIDPAKILTDGYAAVISVEPEPDNSPDPFAIKPLVDSTINDNGPGMIQYLANVVMDLPAGTATLGSSDIPDKGFDLLLDDTVIEGGDLFHLHYYLHNPDTNEYAADVYILLDVFNNYYTYPSWTNISDGLDFEEDVLVDALSSHHKAALFFIWPEGVGSAMGLNFYGLALDSGTLNFIGSLQHITWEYR